MKQWCSTIPKLGLYTFDVGSDWLNGASLLNYTLDIGGDYWLNTVRRVFSNKYLWPIVFVFCLKWAGYLAVASLNLLAQISDRISPFGV